MNSIDLGWLEKWKRNGWRTRKNKPVVNQDLWRELDALLSPHQFTFHWVRGHGHDRSVDTIENNCCHRLAESAAANPVNLLYDEEYERLSGFNSLRQRMHPAARQVALCHYDHEAAIQSELVWSDTELGSTDSPADFFVF